MHTDDNYYKTVGLNDFILRQLRYISVFFSNYSKDYKNIYFFLDQIEKSMFVTTIGNKPTSNFHFSCTHFD